MNDNALDELFFKIRSECLEMIQKKNVNFDDLSFAIGINNKILKDILIERNEDFSLYLKLYEVLLGW